MKMTEDMYKEWIQHKLFQLVGLAVLAVIGYFISSVFDINPALIGMCLGSLLFACSSEKKSKDEKKIDGKHIKQRIERTEV